MAYEKENKERHVSRAMKAINTDLANIKVSFIIYKCWIYI